MSSAVNDSQRRHDQRKRLPHIENTTEEQLIYNYRESEIPQAGRLHSPLRDTRPRLAVHLNTFDVAFFNFNRPLQQLRAVTRNC